VDLAILDRTFSSLPAAAQRLIGSWTQVSVHPYLVRKRLLNQRVVFRLGVEPCPRREAVLRVLRNCVHS
jgi:hypothetical protein